MNAYQRGLKDATASPVGLRTNRNRLYETNKAEKEYWRGYVDGMKSKMQPDEMLVQCEREGRIFIVKKDTIWIVCPTCGRGYQKESDEVFMSDRKLTLL